MSESSRLKYLVQLKHGEGRDLYPLTVMEGVFDGTTGKSLSDVLGFTIDGLKKDLADSVEEVNKSIIRVSDDLTDKINEDIGITYVVNNDQLVAIKTRLYATEYTDNFYDVDLSKILSFIADGSFITINYGTIEPASAVLYDILVEFDRLSNMKQYDGTEWISYSDEDLVVLLYSSTTNSDLSRGSIRLHAGTGNKPTLNESYEGDIWIAKDENNKTYRWNGSEWSDIRSRSFATKLDYIKSLIIASIEVVSQETEPVQRSKGDLWYRPSTDVVSRFDGSSYIDANDGVLKLSVKSLFSPTVLSFTVYAQYIMPEAGTLGSIWINTSNGRVFRYDSFWAPIDVVSLINGEDHQERENLYNDTYSMNASVYSGWYNNITGDKIDSPPDKMEGAYGVRTITTTSSPGQRVRLKPDTYYTLSGSIKSPSMPLGTLAAEIDDDVEVFDSNFTLNTPVPMSYVRYWFSFRTRADAAISTCRFVTTNGMPLDIYQMKLEETSTLSDWFISEYDIMQSLLSLRNSIEYEFNVYKVLSGSEALVEGDLWYDRDSKVTRRWRGGSWNSISSEYLSLALHALLDSKDILDYVTLIYKVSDPGISYRYGSVWINFLTDTSYRWDGTQWIPLEDTLENLTVSNIYAFSEQVSATGILSILSEGHTYADDRNYILGRQIQTFYTNTAPVGTEDRALVTGDLWVDTTVGEGDVVYNHLYRWNGEAWVNARDSATTIAERTANMFRWIVASGDSASSMTLTDEFYSVVANNIVLTANESVKSMVNGRNISTYDDTAPSTGVQVGDIWYDTSDYNRAYRWNGTSWVDVSDTRLSNIEYIPGFVDAIDGLQSQIDGSITTWFYAGVPTDSNIPANSWTTTVLKNQHLGDLYYDNITGYAYRWHLVDDVYSWVRITDTDVTKALEDASKAQDTADGKRRVFSDQPTPPYDVGDLWAQGASGELKICKTAKASGSYAAGDWELATKYTDDTALTNHNDGAKTSVHASIFSQLDTDINLRVTESIYNTTKVWRALNWTDLSTQLTAASTSLAVGLLWYDTSNRVMKRCTNTTGPVWETVAADYVNTSGIEIAGNYLNIKSTGVISVSSSGALNLESGSALYIKSQGKISVESAGTIEFLSGSNLTINLGGKFVLSATNLEITEAGKITASEAYLSGTVVAEGSRVWNRKSLYVGSTAPSSPSEGDIWISPAPPPTTPPPTPPDPVTFSGTWYGSGPGTNTYLNNSNSNQYSGSFSGSGLGSKTGACSYNVNFSFRQTIAYGTTVYIRMIIGGLTFPTQSFTASGTTINTYTASLTGTTWIGSGNSIAFTIQASRSASFPGNVAGDVGIMSGHSYELYCSVTTS